MLTDHVQFCNSNHLSIVMYLICGIHFISVSCLLLGVEIFTNSVVEQKYGIEEERINYLFGKSEQEREECEYFIF